MDIRYINTDVLIIGGGTAGCYSSIVLGENSDVNVVVIEKANIKRSGCLAAGVNAINAYIVEGRTPQDYVDYAKADAHSIVREDLLFSMSERLNVVTKKLEDLGLVILKDENGKYVSRGNRNIKINGENIKPILAEEVNRLKNVTVYNNTNAIEFIVKDNAIVGAFAISEEKEILYAIQAKAVICATGGAAGLYRPNNSGFSRHKMWYPPFNTGAGYAMGLIAGAEMTTFEMRFIALRCKDTIAPTGTIAQGVGAKQINSLGDEYESKYGVTTSQRLHGTVSENLAGRGPCYLQTKGIGTVQDEDLKKAYLNMCPSQTLKWIEENKNPSEQDVEIEGTEPYIMGGHTASGYWVDNRRATTIKGLYAAGDVSGGCPQKYVTGALVEGEIAALSALEYIKTKEKVTIDESKINQLSLQVKKMLGENTGLYSTEDLEEAMQKIMDTYAGGIKTNYQFNEAQLNMADEKIDDIIQLSQDLKAVDMHELVSIFELKERLLICKAVISHLRARKETRWHCFAENLDYPDVDDGYLKYVNSILKDGKIHIKFRELIKKGEVYEHCD